MGRNSGLPNKDESRGGWTPRGGARRRAVPRRRQPEESSRRPASPPVSPSPRTAIGSSARVGKQAAPLSPTHPKCGGGAGTSLLGGG
uniref:Uncharacterized protein n=1 Tax=Oryza glumipatula TaxID=40148 RepID=A0A0D9Z2Z1_9ORYZ